MGVELGVRHLVPVREHRDTDLARATEHRVKQSEARIDQAKRIEARHPGAGTIQRERWPRHIGDHGRLAHRQLPGQLVAHIGPGERLGDQRRQRARQLHDADQRRVDIRLGVIEAFLYRLQALQRVGDIGVQGAGHRTDLVVVAGFTDARAHIDRHRCQQAFLWQLVVCLQVPAQGARDDGHGDIVDGHVAGIFHRLDVVETEQACIEYTVVSHRFVESRFRPRQLSGRQFIAHDPTQRRVHRTNEFRAALGVAPDARRQTQQRSAQQADVGGLQFKKSRPRLLGHAPVIVWHRLEIVNGRHEVLPAGAIDQ